MEPPLTAEKFADFDQFHVGGLAATVELAKRSEITHDMRVLDVALALAVLLASLRKPLAVISLESISARPM